MPPKLFKEDTDRPKMAMDWSVYPLFDANTLSMVNNLTLIDKI